MSRKYRETASVRKPREKEKEMKKNRNKKNRNSILILCRKSNCVEEVGVRFIPPLPGNKSNLVLFRGTRDRVFVSSLFVAFIRGLCFPVLC